jgi:hypothetical protein
MCRSASAFVSLLSSQDSCGGNAPERLATGWTVRGSSPGTDKGFCLLQNISDRVWSQSILLFSRYRCPFLGVKRPGREVDLSPSSRAPLCRHGLGRYMFTFYDSDFDRVSCLPHLVSQALSYFRMLYHPLSIRSEESGVMGWAFSRHECGRKP